MSKVPDLPWYALDWSADELFELQHGICTRYCLNCDSSSMSDEICMNCNTSLMYAPVNPVRPPDWYTLAVESNTNERPCLEFPRFNDLPFEIRRSIWTYALPSPRIVYLERKRLRWFECSRVYSDKAVDETNKKAAYFEGHLDEEAGPDGAQAVGPGPSGQVGFKSQSSIPMLYVCRESYLVASKVYTRAFVGAGLACLLPRLLTFT